MKSVFITGASGTGKTTAYRGLMEYGFSSSPNHLTRSRRSTEIEGVDAHFIDVEKFAANMAIGMYLEGCMAEAEYGGVYYGSPAAWESDILDGGTFVAIPSNVVALRGLLLRLEQQKIRNTVVWANLYAPLEVRRTRVAHYVTNPTQLHTRLYGGVSQGMKHDADINIDTSKYDPGGVLSSIISLIK